MLFPTFPTMAAAYSTSTYIRNDLFELCRQFCDTNIVEIRGITGLGFERNTSNEALCHPSQFISPTEHVIQADFFCVGAKLVELFVGQGY